MSTRERLIAGREALALEVLRSSGQLRLAVRGESMLPVLWPGDVVEVVAHSLPDIRQGEIVLAVREGRLFVHRFVAHSGSDSFVARGDSMPHADPPYNSGALLGRIQGVLRNGRAVSSPLTGRFRHRVFGFLFCHVSVVRRLALRLHHWSTARGSKHSLSPDSLPESVEV